jgi:hypothetical protein
MYLEVPSIITIGNSRKGESILIPIHLLELWYFTAGVVDMAMLECHWVEDR